MLVLTRSEVEELLDVDALFDALARAHAELSSGAASMPPRVAARAGAAGLLGAMPRVSSPYVPALGCKLVSVFPGNVDRTTHQAAIMLFDPANGTPVALMDGTYITETRTAVTAALAAKLLAREDARVLAILGTGVQARSHARAFAGIRDWDEIRVAGRDAAKTQRARGRDRRNARRARSRRRSAAPTSSPRRRTRRSRSSCSTGSRRGRTSARSALPSAAARSIPRSSARRRSSSRAARARLHAPPAGAAELQGLDASDVHAELGELVTGGRPGRTSPTETTLYKSVGVAVQDLAAAALVLAAAEERGAGLEIELEEIHQ